MTTTLKEELIHLFSKLKGPASVRKELDESVRILKRNDIVLLQDKEGKKKVWHILVDFFRGHPMLVDANRETIEIFFAKTGLTPPKADVSRSSKNKGPK